jgi:hypothetical protein
MQMLCALFGGRGGCDKRRHHLRRRLRERHRRTCWPESGGPPRHRGRMPLAVRDPRHGVQKLASGTIRRGLVLQHLHERFPKRVPRPHLLNIS